MSHKNIGDSFDSFLQSEGILEHTENVAIKRVVTYQLQEEMKKHNLSQKKLAEKMNTSRTAVRRLLDPNNESLTIKTLKKAATTLGKTLQIRLV
jgi:predicted XRE-type DNA-binding protein